MSIYSKIIYGGKKTQYADIIFFCENIHDALHLASFVYLSCRCW